MRRFWRSLFSRARLERELDEELRYHLDNETARNVTRGMTPEDAALAARRAMGHMDSVRETVRDGWGLRWLHELRQDVAYALRAFLRAPGFTVTVVLTIALGLGLNGTIFMVFNGYVLRPLQVRDPGALYEPFLVDRQGGIRHFTWSEFQSLKSQAVFAQSAGLRFALGRLNGQLVSIQLVTGDYFSMLGVRPALGRMIEPEDAAVPGAGAVVVLSSQLWRSRFGADSGILGRRLVIHGVSLEVVGVAEPSYLGQFVPIDCWVPLTLLAKFNGQDLFGPDAPPGIMVMGRLASGIGAHKAVVELSAWARAVTAEQPDSDRAASVRLEPRGTMIPLNAEVLAAVLPIVVAFGLVLLIACANVGNMMLARGMARQREIGIRLSLGAGRARLIRQLLTESVLLAVPAALMGLVLARATIGVALRVVLSSTPSEFASLIHVVPLPSDARVLGFTFGSAVLAAVLFGLAPALQSTRAEVVQATRGNFDTPARSARLRSTLVVAQITVCVLLLVVAAVLLRGARHMERLDTGVRSRDAIELSVAESSRARVLERLRTEPGVSLVAAGSAMPFGGIFPRLEFRGDSGSPVHGGFNLVTATYFTLLDIPIIRGRTFTESEARSRAAVAVVSDGAARALWPGRDAVGQTLRIALDPAELRGEPLTHYRTVTVVGVVRDAVAGWLGVSRDWPVVYYPAPLDAPGTTVLVRVAGDPGRALQRLDRDLTTVDSAAVDQIHTEAELREVQVYPFRAAYWVSSLLGGVALLLTITGVYGVLAYVVERRTREVGIRMALGASTRQIVGMVVGEMTTLAAVGIVIGTGLALGASKLLNAYLFMIDTFDSFAYAGGVAVVLLACLTAALVPSRRAARVEPVLALRHD